MYVELCSRDGSDPEAVSGSSTKSKMITKIAAKRQFFSGYFKQSL